MKTRRFWMALGAVSTILAGTLFGGLAACSRQPEEPTHSYAAEWSMNDTEHWKQCDCGEKTQIAAHTYNQQVSQEEYYAGVKEGYHHYYYSCVCGKKGSETYAFGDPIPAEHKHSYSGEWKSDENSHWHECGCGEKADEAAHVFNCKVESEAYFAERDEEAYVKYYYYSCACGAYDDSEDCETFGIAEYDAVVELHQDEEVEFVAGNGLETVMNVYVRSQGALVRFKFNYQGTHEIKLSGMFYTFDYITGETEYNYAEYTFSPEHTEQEVYINRMGLQDIIIISPEENSFTDHFGLVFYELNPYDFAKPLAPGKNVVEVNNWGNYYAFTATNDQGDEPYTLDCTNEDAEIYVEGTLMTFLITEYPYEFTLAKGESILFVMGTADEELKSFSVTVNEHAHNVAGGYAYSDSQHWSMCSCGKIVSMAAHQWNDGTVTTPASCTAQGVKTYVCLVCNATKTENIPVTAHTYAEAWSHDDAEHWHECSCGEKSGTAAHAFTLEIENANTLKSAATVDSNAFYYYSCECGAVSTTEYFEKEGSKLEPEHTHDYTAWAFNATQHWKDCECGDHGTAEDHHWNQGAVTTPASCTAEGEMTYTCTDCGATKTQAISKTEHNYSDAWSANEEKHWQACTDCGAKRNEHNHHWNTGSVQTPAGCTTDGEMLYTCDVCGATKTEAIPAAHNYGDLIAKRDSNCTRTGVEAHYVCSACHAFFDSDQNPVAEADLVIAMKAHALVTDAAVEATCAATGLTEGSHCAVCGHIEVAQQTVPATAHTPETDAAVAATCTATGLTEGSHCSVCGFVITAQTTIAKTEHTFDSEEDEDCNVCGYHRHVHNFATCTGDGAGHHYAVCDHDGCGQETEAEDCSDNNGDGLCDVCGFAVYTIWKSGAYGNYTNCIYIYLNVEEGTVSYRDFDSGDELFHAPITGLDENHIGTKIVFLYECDDYSSDNAFSLTARPDGKYDHVFWYTDENGPVKSTCVVEEVLPDYHLTPANFAGTYEGASFSYVLGDDETSAGIQSFTVNKIVICEDGTVLLYGTKTVGDSVSFTYVDTCRGIQSLMNTLACYKQWSFRTVEYDEESGKVTALIPIQVQRECPVFMRTSNACPDLSAIELPAYLADEDAYTGSFRLFYEAGKMYFGYERDCPVTIYGYNAETDTYSMNITDGSRVSWDCYEGKFINNGSKALELYQDGTLVYTLNYQAPAVVPTVNADGSVNTFSVKKSNGHYYFKVETAGYYTFTFLGGEDVYVNCSNVIDMPLLDNRIFYTVGTTFTRELSAGTYIACERAVSFMVIYSANLPVEAGEMTNGVCYINVQPCIDYYVSFTAPADDTYYISSVSDNHGVSYMVLGDTTVYGWYMANYFYYEGTHWSGDLTAGQTITIKVFTPDIYVNCGETKFMVTGYVVGGGEQSSGEATDAAFTQAQQGTYLLGGATEFFSYKLVVSESSISYYIYNYGNDYSASENLAVTESGGVYSFTYEVFEPLTATFSFNGDGNVVMNDPEWAGSYVTFVKDSTSSGGEEGGEGGEEEPTPDPLGSAGNKVELCFGDTTIEAFYDNMCWAIFTAEEAGNYTIIVATANSANYTVNGTSTPTYGYNFLAWSNSFNNLGSWHGYLEAGESVTAKFESSDGSYMSSFTVTVCEYEEPVGDTLVLGDNAVNAFVDGSRNSTFTATVAGTYEIEIITEDSAVFSVNGSGEYGWKEVAGGFEDMGAWQGHIAAGATVRIHFSGSAVSALNIMVTLVEEDSEEQGGEGGEEGGEIVDTANFAPARYGTYTLTTWVDYTLTIDASGVSVEDSYHFCDCTLGFGDFDGTNYSYTDVNGNVAFEFHFEGNGDMHVTTDYITWEFEQTWTKA